MCPHIEARIYSLVQGRGPRTFGGSDIERPEHHDRFPTPVPAPRRRYHGGACRLPSP
ncbi:protein of unknown function [Cupriavidus taiwanensis]|nr:protein of unknown function [Cupriavidus taiwanensis]